MPRTTWYFNWYDFSIMPRTKNIPFYQSELDVSSLKSCWGLKHMPHPLCMWMLRSASCEYHIQSLLRVQHGVCMQAKGCTTLSKSSSLKSCRTHICYNFRYLKKKKYLFYNIPHEDKFFSHNIYLYSQPLRQSYYNI